MMQDERWQTYCSWFKIKDSWLMIVIYGYSIYVILDIS